MLAQTFTDFELIVVDNHSADKTMQLMQSYCTNERIRYVRNEQTLPMHEN